MRLFARGCVEKGGEKKPGLRLVRRPRAPASRVAVPVSGRGWRAGQSEAGRQCFAYQLLKSPRRRRASPWSTPAAGRCRRLQARGCRRASADRTGTGTRAVGRASRGRGLQAPAAGAQNAPSRAVAQCGARPRVRSGRRPPHAHGGRLGTSRRGVRSATPPHAGPQPAHNLQTARATRP